MAAPGLNFNNDRGFSLASFQQYEAVNRAIAARLANPQETLLGLEWDRAANAFVDRRISSLAAATFAAITNCCRRRPRDTDKDTRTLLTETLAYNAFLNSTKLAVPESLREGRITCATLRSLAAACPVNQELQNATPLARANILRTYEEISPDNTTAMVWVLGSNHFEQRGVWDTLRAGGAYVVNAFGARIDTDAFSRSLIFRIFLQEVAGQDPARINHDAVNRLMAFFERKLTRLGGRITPNTLSLLAVTLRNLEAVFNQIQPAPVQPAPGAPAAGAAAPVVPAAPEVPFGGRIERAHQEGLRAQARDLVAAYVRDVRAGAGAGDRLVALGALILISRDNPRAPPPVDINAWYGFLSALNDSLHHVITQAEQGQLDVLIDALLPGMGLVAVAKPAVVQDLVTTNVWVVQTYTRLLASLTPSLQEIGGHLRRRHQVRMLAFAIDQR